ncbi:MAG: helix-turn-helix domain-containing protein [Clostridia bacterium]|nr:helix-turn-helix domain-containing protein [Clostridia bacterium]
MRDLREDADKTQAEIAAVLHTSQTMYARYERGANALPIHHLMTLCDYFQVSTDAFLGRIPLPKRKEHETPQPHITLPVTENRV